MKMPSERDLGGERMSTSNLRRLRRRFILIAFLIATVGLVLFNMVWYMVASGLPSQLQGLVMITVALLIAFAAAKANRGTQPMFPPSEDKSGGLSTKMSIIVVSLFIATVLIVPAFILWFFGPR